MRGFAVVYLVLGLAFFFYSERLFYLMNTGPNVFGFFEPIALPVEKFWLVLALSMMVMLSLISFFSSIQPRNLYFLFLHLASKATSVAGFLYLFFVEQKAFAYASGALVDLSVFLIVFFIFLTTKEDEKNNHV